MNEDTTAQLALLREISDALSAVAIRWWLFGGWGTGVFLIASGLLALGLLGWSMKNFRYGDMTLEEVYKDRHLKERPRRSE